MKNLEQWLISAFPVRSVKGNEANLNCPKCDHESFYFNLSKRVGHCFSAYCEWSPTLKELLEFIGEHSLDFDYTPTLPEVKPITKVFLPPTAKPITEIVKGYVEARDPGATMALSSRNVSLINIHRFNLHSDRHKIYIPVYDDGKLVQYVGRSIDRTKPTFKDWFDTNKKFRYEYASGSDIQQYFLGWGEAKYWKKLTLVENSFVSIWLRDHFNCSTNFGSNLSDEQVSKIVKSKIQSVVLMWDQGAESVAYKATKKLQKVGIKANYIILPYGQPDNFSVKELNEWQEKAHGS